MADIAEEWRPVVGYEGVYEVSDMGRMKSLERTCNTRSGGRKPIPEIIMKLNESRDYLSVVLCHADAGKTVGIVGNVHRLVAEAFIGPIPKGMHVRHLNGNPHDNRRTNLAIGTPQENAEDSIRHGVLKVGVEHSKTKLSNEEVMELRRMRAEGVAQAKVAEVFGISISSVHAINSGRTWSHLPILFVKGSRDFRSRARGSAHGNAILTDEKVVEVIAFIKRGNTALGAARKFGLSKSNAYGIANGTRWRHIPRE